MISFLRNARKGEKLGATEYSSLLFSPLGLTPVDSFVFGVIQEVILDFPVASKLPNHRVWILCLTGPPVLQPRWWHLRSGPHTSPVSIVRPPILPSFRLGYHRHSQMGSNLEMDTPLLLAFPRISSSFRLHPRLLAFPPTHLTRAVFQSNRTCPAP